MPVPTADLYDKENSQSSTTRPIASTECPSREKQENDSTRGSSSSANRTSLHNTGNDSTLSKDEADRQYEERMEEEYAKREGGA